MLHLVQSAAWTMLGTLLITGLLHTLPALGGVGRAISARACRSLGLDLVVSLLTWLPWVGLGIAFGWRGIVGALIGQTAALMIWIIVHEWTHKAALKGPRIVEFLNRTVGRLNNHIALWVTVVSLPVFVLVRAAEITLYPLLVLLVGLPRYDHGDWVNVSRQKFNGLVGHDRVWCLYCDWMTGVYSLGAEMLRNVESFWCPIRFADGKKCDNCKLDFPDVVSRWAPADGTMADVVARMEEMYGPGAKIDLPAGARNAWFGHPARLTVKGHDSKA